MKFGYDFNFFQLESSGRNMVGTDLIICKFRFFNLLTLMNFPSCHWSFYSAQQGDSLLAGPAYRPTKPNVHLGSLHLVQRRAAKSAPSRDVDVRARTGEEGEGAIGKSNETEMV